MKALLACLALITAPCAAMADLSCSFTSVCLPDEPCKVSDQTLSVTGPAADLTFKMPTSDPYKGHVVPIDGYTMILANLDPADWEILTVAPAGEAQWTVGGAPDMAAAFSYRGTCTGEVK